MKRKRFSVEQIVAIVKQAEMIGALKQLGAGRTAAALGRDLGSGLARLTLTRKLLDVLRRPPPQPSIGASRAVKWRRKAGSQVNRRPRMCSRRRQTCRMTCTT
jgi:hypothetical protein